MKGHLTTVEQTQDVQHSPRLPWRHGTFKPYIYEADGSGAATVTEQFDPERRVALAKFIVRAVNSHDDLVAALEASREVLIGLRLLFMRAPSDDQIRDLVRRLDTIGPIADTALRKARGEE